MIQRGGTVFFYVTEPETQVKDWKKHHTEDLSYNNTLSEQLGLVAVELLLRRNKTMNRFSNYLKLVSKQGSLHRSLHWQMQSTQLRYDHN